jgi:hypothetical protein
MENWNGIGTEVKEVAKGQDSTRDDTNESLFVHAQLVAVPEEAAGWSYNHL